MMRRLLKDSIKESGAVLYDCLQFLVFLFRYITHSRANFALAKDAQRKSLYILGNGPSLKHFLVENDLDRDNVDTCCVNFSPMTDLFMDIKPRYLFFADPGLYNLKDQRVQKTILGIESIDWPMTIVVIHNKLETAKSIYGKNPKIDIISAPQYYLKTKSKLFMKISFSLWKKGKTMPAPLNVIVFALYSGMNLGYKNIFLFGVDHSLLKETFVNKDNIPCLYSAHFYGAPEKPWGSKHPDGTLYDIADLLIDFAQVFKMYHKLAAYASYVGSVNIVNRTKDSWIDAFPRE